MNDQGFMPALNKILEGKETIPYHHLKSLSNLTRENLVLFRQSWPTTPTLRRQQIVQAMTQLTEDNLDLNFRDVLLICLEDPDPEVRMAAIEGLDDDESYILLERLIGIAADDPSTKVRCQAALSLSRFAYIIETSDCMGDYREPLLELLLALFENTTCPLDLRRRAIEAVSYLGGAPRVEEAISTAYSSSEREMRISALHAMGHHMDRRWRPIIERELGNSDPELRYEAALASGEMGDPELVPLLAPLLEDKDHEVARAAIWSLGEIGGELARRLLERCLKRSEPDIREAAEEALHILHFFQDPLGFS
jgi:HEAT repeat protein